MKFLTCSFDDADVVREIREGKRKRQNNAMSKQRSSILIVWRIFHHFETSKISTEKFLVSENLWKNSTKLIIK